MSIQFRKIRTVLNYKKDKPTMYKIAQIGMPKVTFKKLLKEVAHSENVNETQVTAVVVALLNRLQHYLELGMLVSLDSFGSFKVKIRSKVTRSLEDADASTLTRKVIQFIPGKEFRDMLDELNVTSAGKGLDAEE